MRAGHLTAEVHPILLEDLSSIRFEYPVMKWLGRIERNAVQPFGVCAEFLRCYSERRKFSKSCFSSSESELLNREMTALASEPLPACCSIASMRPPFAGVARPS